MFSNARAVAFALAKCEATSCTKSVVKCKGFGHRLADCYLRQDDRPLKGSFRGPIKENNLNNQLIKLIEFIS